MLSEFEGERNIVGKGENADYHYFLLFPQCFNGPLFQVYLRLCGKGLTHYQKMPHFDTLKIYSCRKHCEKRGNCLQQAICLFLTIFSTLYDTYFPFEMDLKMSSEICFNLDQSKILSSCYGLTLSQTKPGFYVSAE